MSKCAVLFPKDQLAADMYSFVSKEGEYARCFVTVSAAPALTAGHTHCVPEVAFVC